MRQAGLCLGILLFSGFAFGQANAPAIANGGILNAASYVRDAPVAPGSLVAIFGSDLAGAPQQPDSVPVSVSVNGTATYVQFASPNQINVQIPWEAAVGSASVVVNRRGVNSAPASVAVTAVQPGIFTADGSGTKQAIVVNNGDGSVAAPVGSIPGLTTHPAKAGDALIIYGTGFGAVNPPGVTGKDSTDNGVFVRRDTLVTPMMLIGGMSAQVLFSGLSPQFVGVNQINVVVPSGAPTGDAVPLQAQVNDFMSTNQVTIAVQP